MSDSKRNEILKRLAILRFCKVDFLPALVDEERRLFVGSIGAAKNKEELQRLGITHILCLAGDIEPSFPDDFNYLTIKDVSDHVKTKIVDRFEECFNFIDTGISTNGQLECGVLVHCLQGKSRSVAVVAGYLMSRCGFTFIQAMDSIRKVRPRAEPNIGFAAQIVKWEIKELNNSPNEE